MPSRDRVGLERGPILVGGVVGGVRIPEVDVEKPVVVASPAVEPVERARDDLVGPFASHAPHQVHGFHDPVVPPRSGMAERKAGDRSGIPPGPVELRRPRVGRQGANETTPAALRPQIGCQPAVVDHTVADTEHAGGQRRARRQARHVGRVDIFKADTPGRDRIDIGCGVAVISVAAEMVGPQSVDVDVEKTHGFGGLLLPGSRMCAERRRRTFRIAARSRYRHPSRAISSVG